MWRPTWHCVTLQLSSPTAGPEVCLLVFLWRAPTSLNARKPTASMYHIILAVRSNRLQVHYPAPKSKKNISRSTRFYARDIRASAILNGDVEPPVECADLYHILDAYAAAYTSEWTSKNMRPKVRSEEETLYYRWCE